MRSCCRPDARNLCSQYNYSTRSNYRRTEKNSEESLVRTFPVKGRALEESVLPEHGGAKARLVIFMIPQALGTCSSESPVAPQALDCIICGPTILPERATS